MRASRVAFSCLVAAFTTLAAFACSLDLDEKLLAAPFEAGIKIGDASLPDGTIITESGVPIIPDAGACAKDEECVSANACLKGRCDLARRACAYDICHAMACNIATCDQNAKTCGPSSTYKLKAGELTLPVITQSGIVAAYPWVFQLTQNGVMAYDVSDPTKSTPSHVVDVTGLGFIPNHFTRSGNRIWFGAALQGMAGPPTRLPLAYIDVPTDPFTTRIDAHTVFATYNRPINDGVGFYPVDNKGALLVATDVAPGPPAVVSYFATPLGTALTEPAMTTATALSLSEGQSPAASTGSRLFIQSAVVLTGQYSNQFALVTDPGTQNQQTRALTSINDTGTVGQQRGFLTTPGGAVVWLTNTVQASVPPTDPATIVTHSVRAYFVVKDGNATIEPAAKMAELEVYPDGVTPAITTPVFGGAAMLDEDTAMIMSLAADNTAAYAINFVKSDGTVMKDKRFVLPTGIGTLFGASASDGFVYIAVNTTVPPPDGMGAGTTTSKIVIVDPACSP